LVKLVDDLREPAYRAREPIDAVDEQHVKAPVLCVSEHPSEFGPVYHRAGELLFVTTLDSPLGLTAHE